MNTNTFRILMLMFIAALVMNAMNYFFYSLHSSRRPIPLRNIEKKFILLEKKDIGFARGGEEKHSASTMLNKLMGISAGPRISSTVSSSPSDYDTTTDSVTTISIYGTVRLGSSSSVVSNFKTG